MTTELEDLRELKTQSSCFQQKSKQLSDRTFYYARLMDKNKLAAARIRIRYIMEEIEDIHMAAPSIASWLCVPLWDEIYHLMSGCSYTTAPVNANGITDDQLRAARNHPITNLVQFVNGKTRAWCHEDKQPSMFYGHRTNKAVCPVCDLKFDPIGVLMTRDGLTFVEAVRSLS